MTMRPSGPSPPPTRRRHLRRTAAGRRLCGIPPADGQLQSGRDGEVYRSAQLSPVEISTFAKAYGIKTIINLRGANPGKAWYDGEVAEARELGVAHLDFRMSARRELTATQAAELVALMKQAEKPLLIHCQAGADRSGLAPPCT